MTTAWQGVVRWAPRVLGTGVALFIGIFALDAFTQPQPLAEALVHFMIHIVPSIVLLAVMAAAWRHEWIGALAFTACALLYAVMVRGRLDWTLIVAGPLLLTGLLFLGSWLLRRRTTEAVR